MKNFEGCLDLHENASKNHFKKREMNKCVINETVSTFKITTVFVCLKPRLSTVGNQPFYFFPMASHKKKTK